MNKLTQEDIDLNRSGALTKDQLWYIKSKGVVNVITGACFLILVPAAVLMADIRMGVLLYVWIGAGLLFAGIFFWSAWGYLTVKKEGHNIQQVTGKAEKKSSGNKNVMLKIQDRSFFVRKGDVLAMKEGEEYTLYFIEEPRIPLGWTKVVSG